MRAIKFRAYTYTPSRGNFILTSDQHGSLTGFFREHEGGNIMQFTGLHDSKGVEIYEGDIVKDGSDAKPLEVVYHDKSATFGFHERHTGAASLFSLGMLIPVKVIGNIYQNPELLK